MINRNLGTVERGLRLLLAFIIAGWLLGRGQHDWLSPVAAAGATALLLNVLFSRCYLWALLGINSCGSKDTQCGTPPKESS
jgi:hypothetical protein